MKIVLAEALFEEITENGVIGTLAFKENPVSIGNTYSQRCGKQ